MTRQDIFATLSDDILGDRCSSSALRGKVSEVKMFINTDKFGTGTFACRVLRGEREEPLGIECRVDVPKNWVPMGGIFIKDERIE